MKDTKKNKAKLPAKISPKLLLAGGIMVATLGYAFNAELRGFVATFMSTSQASASPVGASLTHPQSAPQANTNNTAIKSAGLKLPPRMVEAPTYDEMLASTQIIKQAQNQMEAAQWLAVTDNARLTKGIAEIAQLKAEIAEYRLKEARAKEEQNNLSSPEVSGQSLASKTDFGVLSTETVSTPTDPLNPSATPKAVDVIRFAGVSPNKTITLARNDLFARGITKGQVLWARFEVRDIDFKRNCVQLFDLKSNSTYPDVCKD